MTCRALIDVLGAYHDGELSAPARADVDGHLAACSQCAAYLATYRDGVTLAKGAVRDLDDAEIPDDLMTSILTARPKP